MSATNTFENDLLLLQYNNTNIANIGDATGLRGSSTAGSFYISLHTAWPGETGDQDTNEADYTSYARVAVARSSSGFTVSGNSVSNAAAVNFPKCTGGTNDVFFFGIGTDSSGAGNLKEWGCLGTNKGPFSAADTSGEVITLVGHGLNVDDRVAFFTALGATLPTGITEGTVYFVKTAPDADTITISSTSGGSAIDISAVGSGTAFKMIGLSISNNITPSFAIGALTSVRD